MSSTPHTTSGTTRSALIGLQCHLCKALFPAEATYVCDKCLGPARAGLRLQRRFTSRARRSRSGRRTCGATASCCRSPASRCTGFNSGFTPLVRCDRLAERLGLRELYIKDDSVNHPTLSYKDRVVSVAATRAVELGFKVLACASTGNLANSVVGARGAARPRVLRVHPRQSRSRQDARVGDLSADHSRHRRQLRRREPLCTQVADRYGWGFVNINLRVVLRRGRQDDRVRDRRAARLALSAARGLAGRRRHAAAAHRPRVPRAARDRPRRRRAAAHPRGAGGRLRAGRARARSGARASRAGAARHDRQVDRDRQSRRRLPGAQDRASDRRQRAPRSPTRRSSTRSSCWPRRKGSSPSRPAARRWRRPSI